MGAPLVTTEPSIEISKSAAVSVPPLSLIMVLVNVSVGATSSLTIEQVTSAPGGNVSEVPVAAPAAGKPVAIPLASTQAHVPSVYPSKSSSLTVIAVLAVMVTAVLLSTSVPSIEISKSSTTRVAPLSFVRVLASVSVGAISSFSIEQVTSAPGARVMASPVAVPAVGKPVVRPVSSTQDQLPDVYPGFASSLIVIGVLARTV